MATQAMPEFLLNPGRESINIEDDAVILGMPSSTPQRQRHRIHDNRLLSLAKSKRISPDTDDESIAKLLPKGQMDESINRLKMSDKQKKKGKKSNVVICKQFG